MMCLGLMGPNAGTTMAGKALIRGVERAIRDMPEHELRSNLSDIRDRLDVALTVDVVPSVPSVTPFDGPLLLPPDTWEGYDDDTTGDDLSTGITGV